MRDAPAPPLLFCSYATPDRNRVMPFVEHLGSRGLEAWIDFKQLKAGQDWDREIKRALDKATIILAFISNNSINRRGYVQKELKIALDKYQEKILGDIYLIPVLLDPDTGIPEQVRNLQCVRAWSGDPNSEIEEAIRHQLDAIGAQVQQTQDRSKVRWSRLRYQEMWDGLPGYEVDVELVNLSSTEYRNVEDISNYVRGWITDLIMGEREVKFEQDSRFYNFGQDRFSRCNTIDAHCSDPIIVGKILTMQCAVHSYSTGAAHGNVAISTWAFLLDPVTRIRSIEKVFKEDGEAFPIVQEAVRKGLLAKNPSDTDGVTLDEEWVQRGTANWSDFDSFIFREDGIEFLFSPYHVAAYAAGVQGALVDYRLIVELMHPQYAAALSLGHMAMGDPRWLTKSDGGTVG